MAYEREREKCSEAGPSSIPQDSGRSFSQDVLYYNDRVIRPPPGSVILKDNGGLAYLPKLYAAHSFC